MRLLCVSKKAEISSDGTAYLGRSHSIQLNHVRFRVCVCPSLSVIGQFNQRSLANQIEEFEAVIFVFLHGVGADV